MSAWLVSRVPAACLRLVMQAHAGMEQEVGTCPQGQAWLTDVGAQRQRVNHQILAARAELHEAAEALQCGGGGSGGSRCSALNVRPTHKHRFMAGPYAAANTALLLSSRLARRDPAQAGRDACSRLQQQPAACLEGAVVVRLQIDGNLLGGSQPLGCTNKQRGTQVRAVLKVPGQSRL